MAKYKILKGRVLDEQGVWRKAGDTVDLTEERKIALLKHRLEEVKPSKEKKVKKEAPAKASEDTAKTSK